MSPNRLFSFTLISASLLLCVMSFLFYLGNKLLIERSPLIEAAEEIKLEATTAHLWFEEIMSGDGTESIEGVWKDIDSADWYAKAMLDGGTNTSGTYYPLVDPVLRQLIKEVRKDLLKFKEIALLRYEHFSESIPGTDSDTQFDKIFKEFIGHANLVQEKVKDHIQDEFEQYQHISYLLIFISFLTSIFLSNFLYKRELQRESLMLSLTKATASIESKNKELYKQAHYDSLTGLPNRILFLDRLDQSITHAMRANTSSVIMFIDLDHFKEVNDQYGHQNGDKLLQEVSQRIMGCIRNDDTAVRISGDEFVVILNGHDDINAALNASNKVADDLINTLQKVFHLQGSEAYITASIGISIYPEDSSNGEELTKFADKAMYHAKSLGKNNFQFYSKELSQQSNRRLKIERDLRIAIEEDQFILHFHPQWQLDTGKVSGLEVLVRWQHPKRGLVFPDEFIGVAESCGLIQKLDFLIMQKALTQHKQWHEKGFDFGTISINVSAIYFSHKSFIENTQHLIESIGVRAESIEIEILESVLIENNKSSQQTLDDLHQLGVKVAIDDFGTGYSSMSYLRDFKVHTLKIDRSFVSGCNLNNTSKVILKNMITLGKDLGLKVIAEGIETAEEEETLKFYDCEVGQGYYLTKPLPEKKVVELLKLKQENNIINLGLFL